MKKKAYIRPETECLFVHTEKFMALTRANTESGYPEGGNDGSGGQGPTGGGEGGLIEEGEDDPGANQFQLWDWDF